MRVRGRSRVLEGAPLWRRLAWRASVRPLVACGTLALDAAIGVVRLLGGATETKEHRVVGHIRSPDPLSWLLVQALTVPWLIVAEACFLLADMAARGLGGVVIER